MDLLRDLVVNSVIGIFHTIGIATINGVTWIIEKTIRI